MAFAANSVLAVDTLYDQRFKRWVDDAQKGDPVAEYNLANAYLRGNEVDRDIKKALGYLRKSAAKDYAKAEYKLGYLYFTGRGVKGDYNKAFGLFQKAAQQEYSPGEFYLGKCYAEGKGTERDLRKALFWTRRAAQGDYYGAKQRVAQLTATLASENAAQVQPVSHQAGGQPTLKVPPPPVAKPRSRSAATQARTSKPPKKHIAGPEGLLVAGNWMNEGGLPSRHMPSALTSCDIKQGTVTCRTKPLKRASIFAQVSYMVESTFGHFQKNGHFMGSYRTKILAVAAENTGDSDSAGADIPKVGWQGRTVIRCAIKDHKHIDCVNDNFRFEHFNRK